MDDRERQILADEAYARREQARLDGDDNDVVDNAVANLSPLMPRQSENARQVRLNMMHEMRRNNNARQAFVCSVCVNLPQIVAAAVVLAMYWDRGRELCDDTWIRLWSLVHAARLGVILLLQCSSLCERDEDGFATKIWIGLSGAIYYFSLFWLGLGCYLVFLNDHACKAEAPQIYRLAWWLVSFNLLVLVFPCLLFICLIPIVCFCLPCLLRFIAWLQQPNPQVRAREIAQFPLSRYKPRESKRDQPEDTEDCSICLVTFAENDEIRTLPCDGKHFFHSSCIDQWLITKDTCPICRGFLFGERLIDPLDDSRSASAALNSAAAGARSRANRSDRSRASHSHSQSASSTGRPSYQEDDTVIV